MKGGETVENNAVKLKAAQSQRMKAKYMKLKVAEHSFQEPMPNSPLLFSHLCFGARFLQV